MFKRFLLIIVLLFIPLQAQAQMQVHSIDDVKVPGFTTVKANVYEIPTPKEVWDEVYYLQESVPTLRTVDWSVYIVAKKCFYKGRIGGLVMLEDTEKAYIFADYSPSYIIAHEIGHMVRFNFISKKELLEYWETRKTRLSAEEVFAEDFRWFFGVDHVVGYNLPCPPPEEKHRQWMLAHLNKGDN